MTITSAAALQGLWPLLAAHPGLLLEHAQAHVALALLDLAEARARVLRQALWWAAAGVALAAALTLAGVASLLLLTPAGQGANPWWLASVPALPLALALFCVAGALGRLRPQTAPAPGPWARLQADLALLRADLQPGA